MTLYLIASIAGQRVAVAASAVESVVEIDATTPVPLAPPHVAGLAALRSRVLTLIDCHAALGLGRTALHGNDAAIVVVIEGHLYGLLVERVEDVVEHAEPPVPLATRGSDAWHPVARGLVELAPEPALLIDPAALVAGPLQIAC